MSRLIPLFLFACAVACTPKMPARSVIDCKLDVLEPYLQAMTQEAVSQLLAGSPSPTELILSAGITTAEARAVADRILACHKVD